MFDSRRAVCRAYAVGWLWIVATSSIRAQALEQEILVPPTGNNAALFSFVDADDDLLVVGAPGDDTGAASGGCAFVYRRDATTGEWKYEQQLLASDPATGTNFGLAVAVDGDVIVVGAPTKLVGSTNVAGAVYVFRYLSGAWSEEQRLTSSNASNRFFGWSVAVENDLLVIGAPTDQFTTVPPVGSAWVFRYDDATTSWNEEQELVDPDGAGGDAAGATVAIDGSVVFVASPEETEAGASKAGSVSVWVDSGSGWTQSQELVSSGARTDGLFGGSIDADADELVIGASGEDASSTVAKGGAAYLVAWDGSQWTEVQRLPSPDPGNTREFGHDVALDGDLVVVSSPSDARAGMHNVGRAWLYRRRVAGARWKLDQEVAASDAADMCWLGDSVTASDGAAFIGAPLASTKWGLQAGEVYRYDSAELTLELDPSDPAPGAQVDLELHRGDPSALFLVAIESADGSPLFIPIILDVFGADHSFALTGNAPNPAFGVQLGLRAWKASNLGPIVVSEWAFIDV